MTPIHFEQANVIIGKDQPEYISLPAHIDNTPESRATCCFELSPEEKEEIAKTGKLWFSQLTFGHPFSPILLSTTNPFN